MNKLATRIGHLEAALRYYAKVIEKLPPHVDTKLLEAKGYAQEVLDDVISPSAATMLEIDPNYPEDLL